MTTCDVGNGAEFFKAIALGGAKREYETVGSAKTVGGVKGKIVKRSGTDGNHSDLPQYAVTSDMYFRQNESGVCQARVYLDHKMTIDFDWSHAHTNKTDGRRFERGVPHCENVFEPILRRRKRHYGIDYRRTSITLSSVSQISVKSPYISSGSTLSGR